MMNGKYAMFGRLKGRCTSAFTLAAFVALALSGDVLGQAWELEREKGVGGGSPSESPANVATLASEPKKTGKRAGARIVINNPDEPVIRAAEGIPVNPFDDVDKPDSASDAAIAAAQAEAAAAAASRSSARVPDVADETKTAAAVRSNPPTAVELLNGSTPKSIVTTAIDDLPEVRQRRAAAATPRALTDVVDQTAPIEQAQFSPNTAAEPKAILPPRVVNAPSDRTAAPVIMPSPPKPALSEPTLQQALLTPNVAASPKEPLLRTAPAPDNKLVELVETPTDYSLALPAGTGRLLNLGKEVTDVFVADPNVADVKVVSPKQLFAHGNKLGKTNIFGIGVQGDVIFAVDVDVVPDAKVAQSELASVAPAVQADVALNSGTLVADGSVSDVGEAINVASVAGHLTQTQGPTVNNTTIEGSQQVNIRVRFAEVSRNDVFNLGINWEALVDTGDFLFGLSTGSGQLSPVDPESFGTIFGDAQFGDVNIEAFIDALQREGIINLLAEPNLTAINGETANFLAGGEIPILVPGGGGGDTVTIDYKPFGVSLDFIPTLLPGDRINLRVRPEVSSINTAGGVVLQGFEIPAFTVRRAETSVELASGQTFAIAGLFQRDLTTDTDKFPVLGDVPVLGQLFQSQRFRRYETELVILITPYLVQPTSNRNIALPNDRLDGPTKPLVKKDKKRAGFIIN
jgi:pilus assembly protein CpaC